jgi:hypothetical protein
VLLSTLKNHSTAPKVAAVELKLNINQAAFLAQKGNLTAQLAKVAGVDPSRVEARADFEKARILDVNPDSRRINPGKTFEPVYPLFNPSNPCLNLCPLFKPL